MTNQTHKRALNATIILAMAWLLVLVLWLTVFSRLGSESRHFYPPFWSYKAILNGSGKALIEDVGNVILFIPVGATVSLFLGSKIRMRYWQDCCYRCSSNVVSGCSGSFEIDDLLHNTIGAGIGAAIVRGTALG